MTLYKTKSSLAGARMYRCQLLGWIRILPSLSKNAWEAEKKRNSRKSEIEYYKDNKFHQMTKWHRININFKHNILIWITTMLNKRCWFLCRLLLKVNGERWMQEIEPVWCSGKKFVKFAWFLQSRKVFKVSNVLQSSTVTINISKIYIF